MAQYYYSPNELYHYGILGMKWGVRRYQNEDGSLTEAGKRRYRSESIQKAASEVHSQLTSKSVRHLSKESIRESASKKIGLVSKADMENANDDVRKAMNKKRLGSSVAAGEVAAGSALAGAGALTGINNVASAASFMQWKKFIDITIGQGMDPARMSNSAMQFFEGMARSSLPVWAIAATSPTLVTAAQIMAVGVPVAATAIAGYKAYKSNKVAKLIADANDKNIDEMTPKLSDKDRKAIEDQLKSKG